MKFIKYDKIEKPEIFQRKYGCYGKAKDARNTISLLDKEYTSQNEGLFIDKKFNEFIKIREGNNIEYEFMKHMKESYNFEEKQLKEFISQYDLSDLDKFLTKFISISVEGDGIKFERIIDSVMKKHFNLNSIHTGQARVVAIHSLI